MTRIITAAFDTRATADAAIARLKTAGVPASQIRVLPEATTAYSAGSASYDTQRDEKGFWATLAELFMPDDDRSTYAEAMHRGHVIVTVTAEDALATKVEDILDDEGTLNLDEHERKWRSEGWPGAAARTSAATSGLARSGTTGTTSQSKESIPIVEERLNVGKRVENNGRVRVRSYTVETPVSEQVNLRQENVSVERRPVDRPLGAAADAFKERTIEATETRERAVVNKEARVTEEVVLNKNVENRTETIKDTVRKTEVEVDDKRTPGAARREV